jgi:hypothetical protein
VGTGISGFGGVIPCGGTFPDCGVISGWPGPALPPPRSSTVSGGSAIGVAVDGGLVGVLVDGAGLGMVTDVGVCVALSVGVGMAATLQTGPEKVPAAIRSASKKRSGASRRPIQPCCEL